MIAETELILNTDGSIYHLGLLPEQVCKNIVLVGDPDRVKLFEHKLDRIFYKNSVREFHSMMGEIYGTQILIISTGIGTDNIDIVLNELDALINVDFKTRKVKSKKTSLNVVRIGTSGSLQENIPVDSFLASTQAIGLDLLMNFYQRELDEEANNIERSISSILKKEKIKAYPYVVKANDYLLKKLGKNFIKGMTITLPGFYGPQGREVRVATKSKDYLNKLKNFEYKGQRITNLEMETSGIYGMSEILGHKAISLNAILANRSTKEFSKNPAKIVDKLIDEGLVFISKL
jgi:uridine phosphorylase